MGLDLIDELTLIECTDRLSLLQDQIEAKSNEIEAFKTDLSNASAQTPSSSASPADRIKFSEQKQDIVRRTKSALQLAEDDLKELKGRFAAIERRKIRLEAIAEFEPARKVFMSAQSKMAESWEQMAAAARKCSDICELNFPKTKTFDEMVKAHGVMMIDADSQSGKYHLVKPS